MARLALLMRKPLGGGQTERFAMPARPRWRIEFVHEHGRSVGLSRRTGGVGLFRGRQTGNALVHVLSAGVVDQAQISSGRGSEVLPLTGEISPRWVFFGERSCG